MSPQDASLAFARTLDLGFAEGWERTRQSVADADDETREAVLAFARATVLAKREIVRAEAVAGMRAAGAAVPDGFGLPACWPFIFGDAPTTASH